MMKDVFPGSAEGSHLSDDHRDEHIFTGSNIIFYAGMTITPPYILKKRYARCGSWQNGRPEPQQA